MHLNTIFLRIPSELKSYLYVSNTKNKFIIFNNVKNTNSFFIFIPSNIFISIKNSNVFVSSYNIFCLKKFLNFFFKYISILRFPFFVKLFLKGLGFRIKLITQNNSRLLEFKLGFSHLILLKIPSLDIAVTIKKNSLILVGFSKTDIGNLANRVFNLRLPNAYTGKGFRYKRVPLFLKDVKKTP